MVATIEYLANGSVEERAALIAGRARIPQEKVSAELWAMLLREALPQELLKSLMGQAVSLQKILTANTAGRVSREGLEHITTALEGAGVVAQRFLLCSDMAQKPANWRDAPRRKLLAAEVLTSIEDSFVVVPVTKSNPVEFLRVGTLWQPVVNWGTYDHAPEEFYYDLVGITLTKLDDTCLGEFAIREYSKHVKMGIHMLWRLRQTMCDQREALARERRFVARGERDVTLMMENMGQPF